MTDALFVPATAVKTLLASALLGSDRSPVERLLEI